MTRITPSCSACKDRGWVVAPYYGDLNGPILRGVMCPICRPRATATRSEVFFVVAAFAFALAMVAKAVLQ